MAKLSFIPASTLKFLRQLEKNNNRDWFNNNKTRYQEEHQHMIQFAENLLDKMSQYDNLVPMTGKQSLFRIYRDVRFSKNKNPYKSHFSGRMKRATKYLRGGYYYHIEPGNKSIIAGGFWQPSPPDLLRIRKEIMLDAASLRKIINAAKFKKTFGTLQGEKLKTAPRGFPKDHPDIDLLRYKHFLVFKKFTDKEVQNPKFLNEAIKTFRAMRPFFDYMSEVLTTDLNGVSIFEE